MKRHSATLAAVGLGFLMLQGASHALAQAPTFLAGQQQGEVMAYRLGGTQVFNAKGEVIGTISDIALDAKGQATAVVVSVGGFLGLGSKQVAVPFSLVRIGPVVEGSRVILINLTKEQLQGAQSYVATDPSRVDRARKKASDWAKIAKDKAIELGKQAGEAVQGIRERMNQPQQPTPQGSSGGGTAGSTPAPAPVTPTPAPVTPTPAPKQ